MSTNSLSFPGIISLFDLAAQRLQYPKIRLVLDSAPIVLIRAGAKSKYPGAVNVTDGGSYGNNVWYGRINRDGSFFASQSCTGDFAIALAALLSAFSADPSGTARVYGLQTSSCCFCGLTLTNPDSLAVGYGPICAENFGLPYAHSGNTHQSPVHVADLFGDNESFRLN